MFSHDADIVLLVKRSVCLPVLMPALVGRILCSFLKEVYVPAIKITKGLLQSNGINFLQKSIIIVLFLMP